MPEKTKIDVYLTIECKRKIIKKAKELDLSVSDYVKLKALDMLKENK